MKYMLIGQSNQALRRHTMLTTTNQFAARNSLGAIGARTFSSIDTPYAMILYSAASFLRRIKRMILKRIVIFRIMFYGTLILTVGTFLQANKVVESSNSITPSYFI